MSRNRLNSPSMMLSGFRAIILAVLAVRFMYQNLEGESMAIAVSLECDWFQMAAVRPGLSGYRFGCRNWQGLAAVFLYVPLDGVLCSLQ